MERLVVVGASLAGLRAAEAARAAGFDGSLVVVGAEVHPPYNRPPLSKQLLAGTMEREAVAFRHALECEWRLGVRAAGLDVGRRVVALADGGAVGFDALVIATGSAARPWHEPLPALDGLHSLRELDEALALREAVRACVRPVVVGAGFIGCEVAATLRGLGRDVTLVDVAPHPMPPLGPELGAVWTELHRARGVDLRLGTGVAAFEDDGAGRLAAVRLADGERVAADVCLVATGAVPCTDWLRGSGLELEPGVVCDASCAAVGADGVFAAGDVARWPHPLAGGELVRVEHWSNAAEMGRVAGRNAVVAPEERTAYEAVPSFWSDQYDWKIQSVGFPTLAERFEVVEGAPEEARFVAVGERAGRPVAAVGVNAARAVMGWRRELAAVAAAG